MVKQSLSLFAIFSFALMMGMLASVSYAANDTVPNFPSCTTKTADGDWSHSAQGFHHVPGQEATIEGSDDVYYVSEGNFVQCLCPTNGTSGIQTNWWNVDGVSPETIAQHKQQQGWMEEQGSAWNLMSHTYLAQNVNYSCAEVTPTPTPTGTVSPTPTPTQVPPVGGSNSPMPSAPQCPDPAPTAPTLLSVSKSGADGVELVWSEPDSNVNYYIISYGYEQNKEMFGVPNTGKTTRFRIGGLDLNKKYFFKVRSQKGCAVSGASNELSYPQTVGKIKNLANTDSRITFWLLVSGVFAGLSLAAWSLKLNSRFIRS